MPNASLINSIAQSIGLHDFYQVGLWNFCEGYMNEYVPLLFPLVITLPLFSLSPPYPNPQSPFVTPLHSANSEKKKEE